MSFKVEKITETLILGEGPHWDDRQQALFYVGILDKSIHKYVPATKEYAKTILSSQVSFIVPVDETSDKFVVGLGRKCVIIQWDGKNGSSAKVVKEIAEVDKDVTGMQINDGKADPRGRIYFGTLNAADAFAKTPGQKGSLYVVNQGKVTKVDDKLSLSNGLAWDLKEKAFYFIDSHEHNIRRYDYDVNTGDISNMKHIFDFKKNNVEGSPDGMTIDTNGNLWVAIFGDSSIGNIDPRTGKLLQKIQLPVPQVTSITFGGPNLDKIFVTTGNLKLGGEEPPPGSGATFMITGADARGLPNVHYKI